MQKTFPVGLIATICVFSLNILNVTGQWYFPVVYKNTNLKLSKQNINFFILRQAQIVSISEVDSYHLHSCGNSA